MDVINGRGYPMVASVPTGCSLTENFMTHREKVSAFLDADFDEMCKSHHVESGAVINLAVTLYGVEFTVNGQSNIRRSTKMKINRSTRLNRVYYLSNYIARLDEQKGRFVAEAILDDDEWLVGNKVQTAFELICQTKAETKKSTIGKVIGKLKKGKKPAGWKLETLSPVRLSEVTMSDGQKFIAWTASVEDTNGEQHMLVCLIQNGVIIVDAEATATDVAGNKNTVRAGDNIFRLEGFGVGSAMLWRL